MTANISSRSRIRWSGGLLAAALVAVTPVLADYDQGLAYFKQGKFVEAAAEWEEVVNNAPDYDFGYFMLGNCYLKLKKYREAETEYRKAVELNPGKFDYHMNLSQAQLQARNYNEVVVTLDKAEALAETPAQKKLLYRTRGLALTRVKDYGRAISDLKQANPAGDYTVAVELGRACFAVDDNACVESALTKALALKGDDEISLEILTKSHIETARRASGKATKEAAYSKAVKTARQLASSQPASVEAHELLGAALLGADDFKGAIREFEIVLEKEPKNCNALLNIAQALAKLEDWKQMLSRAQQASRCDPKSQTALTQIAFVHNKLKQWDEAEAAARKALNLNDNSSARQQLKIAQDGRAAQQSIEEAERAELEYKEALARAEQERLEQEKKIKEYETRTGQKGEGGD
jgi:tetratricopeptide (TPR) repeat protein